MWPGAHIIHLRGSSSSAECSFLHETIDFIGTSDRPLTQALYKNTFFLVFTDLETSAVNFQEVRNHLVVDLEVGCTYHECRVLVWLHLDKTENLLHWTRHNTSLRISSIILEPLHCMCFSSSRLSISKYRSIIPLKYRENGLFSCVLIDIFLSGRLIIHMIESEVLPHTQMWVLFHISLFFSFIDLSS